MLQEANGSKRQELLQHANADQINAVSELVLNFLKNKIPVTPPMLAKLQPYKKVLRDLGRRRHSSKNVGRGWFNKKDAACFKDFTRCYVNVLDRPVNPWPHGSPCYKRPIGPPTGGKTPVLIGSINITCCIESTNIC